MTRLMIFGDSLTLGYWDIEGGYAQRLRKVIDMKNLSDPDFYWVVYNLGVNSDDSVGLLKRMENEIKARIKETEETVVLVCIGENDSQFIHSLGENRVSIKTFRSNLKQIIQTARKYASKLAFIGLVPVDESRTTPIPWRPDKSYKNEYIEKYNSAIEEVCKEENVPFLDTFHRLKEMNYKELLEDGLHPNSKGHEVLFDMVKNFLEREEILPLQ